MGLDFFFPRLADISGGGHGFDPSMYPSKSEPKRRETDWALHEKFSEVSLIGSCVELRATSLLDKKIGFSLARGGNGCTMFSHDGRGISTRESDARIV